MYSFMPYEKGPSTVGLFSKLNVKTWQVLHQFIVLPIRMNNYPLLYFYTRKISEAMKFQDPGS